MSERPQYKSEGCCAKEIFPLVARNKVEANETLKVLQDMIFRSKGLIVYRAIEGGPKKAQASLAQGDIVVTPIGGDLPETDDFFEVARIVGSEDEILRHFRIFTKAQIKKDVLKIPPFTQLLKEGAFTRPFTVQDEYFKNDKVSHTTYQVVVTVNHEGGQLICGTDLEKVRSKVVQLFTFGKSVKGPPAITKDTPIFRVEFEGEDISAFKNDMLDLGEFHFSLTDIVKAFYAEEGEKFELTPQYEETLLDLAAILFHPADTFFSARRALCSSISSLVNALANQEFWTEKHVHKAFEEGWGLNASPTFMEVGLRTLKQRQAAYHDLGDKIDAVVDEMDGLLKLIDSGYQPFKAEWEQWKDDIQTLVIPKETTKATAENSA